MDWFYLYSLGFLVVVAGVAFGLNLIGVPPRWIVVVMLFLVAVGVLTLVKRPGGGRTEDR